MRDRKGVDLNRMRNEEGLGELEGGDCNQDIVYEEKKPTFSKRKININDNKINHIKENVLKVILWRIKTENPKLNLWLSYAILHMHTRAHYYYFYMCTHTHTLKGR